MESEERALDITELGELSFLGPSKMVLNVLKYAHCRKLTARYQKCWTVAIMKGKYQQRG